MKRYLIPLLCLMFLCVAIPLSGCNDKSKNTEVSDSNNAASQSSELDYDDEEKDVLQSYTVKSHEIYSKDESEHEEKLEFEEGIGLKKYYKYGREFTFEYDEKGLLSKAVFIPNGSLYTMEIIYDWSDDENSLTVSYVRDSTEETYKLIYTFDSNGRIIELTEYKDGAFTSTNKLTYSETLKRRDTYDEAGDLKKYTEIKLDEYGNAVETNIYTAEDDSLLVNYNVKNFYDESNNLVMIEQYNSNELEAKYSISYSNVQLYENQYLRYVKIVDSLRLY